MSRDSRRAAGGGLRGPACPQPRECSGRQLHSGLASRSQPSKARAMALPTAGDCPKRQTAGEGRLGRGVADGPKPAYPVQPGKGDKVYTRRTTLSPAVFINRIRHTDKTSRVYIYWALKGRDLHKDHLSPHNDQCKADTQLIPRETEAGAGVVKRPAQDHGREWI